jgi:acyl carrier protein
MGNNTNNLNQLMALLSRILEIDGKLITNDTSPENTETWDSFRGLLIISEVETLFNVHFTIDEVLRIRNVNDIKIALTKRGIDLK